jgi:hypothetical protein
LVGTVEARLGEDYNQLVARYGEPTKINSKDQRTISYEFEKGDFIFDIALLDGKAGFLFVKANDRDLTVDEVNVFLRKNSAGSGFDTIGDGKWFEKDTERTAIVDRSVGITIFTNEFIKYIRSRPEPDTESKLKTF